MAQNNKELTTCIYPSIHWLISRTGHRNQQQRTPSIILYHTTSLLADNRLHEVCT